MKAKITFLSIVMGTALAIFAFTGCDDSKPDTATIHGTITFRNVDVWKASGTGTKADVDSGEVQVTIFGDGIWADQGGGYVVPGGAPFNAQNPLILTRVASDSTYEYSLEVDPGTYSALAVGFRTNRNVSADMKTATLGVYWNMPNQVSHGITIPMSPFNYPAPVAITVAKGDDVALNFVADFGFVNMWFQ
ncbi:hypothetical protein JNM05_00785 [bacterium]|nr:hypothetical protein [bacterium]